MLNNKINICSIYNDSICDISIEREEFCNIFTRSQDVMYLVCKNWENSQELVELFKIMGYLGLTSGTLREIVADNSSTPNDIMRLYLESIGQKIPETLVVETKHQNTGYLDMR